MIHWFVIGIPYFRELWIEEYCWTADISCARFIIWQVGCFVCNKWICKLLNSTHSTSLKRIESWRHHVFHSTPVCIRQKRKCCFSTFHLSFMNFFAYLQWAWDTYEWEELLFSRIAPNLLSECVNLNLNISISIDVYCRQFHFIALKCILVYAFDWIQSLLNWFSREWMHCNWTILKIFR